MLVDGIVRGPKKPKSESIIPFPRIKEIIDDTEKISNIDKIGDINKRNFLKVIGMLGAGALLFSIFPKKSKAAGLIFGSSQRAPDPIGLKNSTGNLINPATKEGQFPSGDSMNGTIDLTLADTWYAVPAEAPANDYVIVVSLENSSGTVRFGLSNTGSPSATNGNQAPTHLSLKLGAGKSVYFASSTAGDDVNYTLIESS